MSKGRMIDRRLRTSQTFARLTYRQRDLWQGLIQVADDQGRLPGNPAYIRSVVWPYDDITAGEVKADLDVLADAENILLYTVAGNEYLQIVNWHVYQKEAEWLGISDYPAPDGWQDHCRYHGKNNRIITVNWETRTLPTPLPPPLPTPLPSRDVNDDVKGKGDGKGDGKPAAEVVLRGGGEFQEAAKPKTSAAAAETPVQTIFTIYEAAIGPIPPTIVDQLKAAESDYRLEWIARAFEIAAEQNKRNWAYVKAILRRWNTEGYDAGKKNGKPAEVPRLPWVTEDMISTLENIRLNPPHIAPAGMLEDARQRLHAMGVTDDQISTYCAS